MARPVISTAIDVAAAFTDFPLADIAHSIEGSVQTLRFNRDDAQRLSRSVLELSSALEDAEEQDDGSPSLIQQTEELRRVLLDVQARVEVLSRRGYVSQILHQGRDRDELRSMQESVQDVFSLLKINMAIGLSSSVQSRERRSPVLDRALERGPPSRRLSCINPSSAIPPLPRLFGRSAELEAVVASLTSPAAGHVAILGGPGMGKTSLALAALHHPRVVDHFGKRRFFVPCDASEYKDECLGVVAAAFGLSSGSASGMRTALLRVLSGAPALLVLDNLETAWEPTHSRANAERLLQTLAALGNVAIVVTMRGTERPQGISWHRPFLAPLSPLEDDAAKQTFFSVADVPDTGAKLEQILRCIENVPLAVVLMANQAQCEPLDALLRRWDDVKTSMLTRGDGQHRLNSLDISIATSLGSPRMRQLPDAQSLLALLSLLPQGAMDADIGIWGEAYPRQAVSVLLQSALAYRTLDDRLRVLAPIREYMLSKHPPSQDQSSNLCEHYFRLPRLCLDPESIATASASMAALTPELENLEALVLYSLRHCADKSPSLKAAIHLGVLYANSGMRSPHTLIPAALAASRTGGSDLLTADLLTVSSTLANNTTMPGDPLKLLTEARVLYERADTDPLRGIEARILIMRYARPPDAIAEAARVTEIAQKHGLRDVEVRCQRALAAVYERMGRPGDALACHERALGILRELQRSPDAIWADCLVQIAVFHGEAGYVSRALEELREAQAVGEDLRDTRCQSLVHLILGQTLLQQGEISSAIRELRRATELCRTNQNRQEFFCLSDLLVAHLALNDERSAVHVVEDAQQTAISYGHAGARARSYVAWMQGELALHRGDSQEALSALHAARAICRDEIDPADSYESLLFHEAKICIVMGRVAQADGRLQDAARYFTFAAVVRAKFRICTDTVSALARLAEVVDDQTSEALVGATMVALRRFGYWPSFAGMLMQSARVADRRGLREAAIHRARNALRVYDSIDDAKGVARAQDLLRSLTRQPGSSL